MNVQPEVPERLAVYAATEAQSQGRIHDEAEPAFRSQFQRDRDRVIHSAAFRRLEYKTQVFVNHEGDMFRTRLTHSLEVAQIARTVARSLRLNEELTEAIALAHDLGHTPFGHAGQTALNACMLAHGGFEHNFQSLRVVDVLEEPYLAFRGLNLLFETREGILKHCNVEKAKTLGDLGRRFLERRQASAEAQLANIADEIAYNHHDIDDGLRSGLLQPRQLLELPQFERRYRSARDAYPKLSDKRIVRTAIRGMLNAFVIDLIENSQATIAALGPTGQQAIRAHSAPVIGLSEPLLAAHLELKRFLRRDLYNHERVRSNTANAALVLKRLFETFVDDTSAMRIEELDRPLPVGEKERMRFVADYIAGMTDRFAISEYRRLFNETVFVNQ